MNNGFNHRAVYLYVCSLILVLLTLASTPTTFLKAKNVVVEEGFGLYSIERFNDSPRTGAERDSLDQFPSAEKDILSRLGLKHKFFLPTDSSDLRASKLRLLELELEPAEGFGAEEIAWKKNLPVEGAQPELEENLADLDKKVGTKPARTIKAKKSEVASATKDKVESISISNTEVAEVKTVNVSTKVEDNSTSVGSISVSENTVKALESVVNASSISENASSEKEDVKIVDGVMHINGKAVSFEEEVADLEKKEAEGKAAEEKVQAQTEVTRTTKTDRSMPQIADTPDLPKKQDIRVIDGRLYIDGNLADQNAANKLNNVKVEFQGKLIEGQAAVVKAKGPGYDQAFQWTNKDGKTVDQLKAENGSLMKVSDTNTHDHDHDHAHAHDHDHAGHDHGSFDEENGPDHSFLEKNAHQHPLGGGIVESHTSIPAPVSSPVSASRSYRTANSSTGIGGGKKILLADVYEEDIPCYQHYNFNWDSKKVHSYKYDLTTMPDTVEFFLTHGLNDDFKMPVFGRVTSNFGPRWGRHHNGIDLDLDKGDQVFSAFKGKIRVAKYSSSYGYMVIIRHYNGLETFYAHLSKLLVKANDDVDAGSVIGLGGSTGRSTGAHLHFEVRYKGHPINPNEMIDFNSHRLKSHTFIVTKDYFSSSDPYSSAHGGSRYHTIRRGDTLYKIARRYGTTVNRICSLNKISSKTTLKVGRKLKVG